jgi:hypothetical protein
MNGNRKLIKATSYVLIGFLPTALVCMLLLFICPLTSSIYYSQDKAAIANRYNQMYLAKKKDDVESAYSYMSPEYRQTHILKEFLEDYSFHIHGWDTLHPEHSVMLSGNRATLYPRRYDFFDFYVGPSYELVKVDGEWYFTGEANYSVD